MLIHYIPIHSSSLSSHCLPPRYTLQI
jgi:hypothetical protein